MDIEIHGKQEIRTKLIPLMKEIDKACTKTGWTRKQFCEMVYLLKIGFAEGDYGQTKGDVNEQTHEDCIPDEDEATEDKTESD